MQKSFTDTKGTIFYRLRTDALTVMLVITLLAVDGLASYVKAFQRAFRTPFRAKGALGLSRLIAWPKIAIVQVVKQRRDKILTIDRRIVQGCEKMITRLLLLSQNGGQINTAPSPSMPPSDNVWHGWLAALAFLPNNLKP